MFHFNIFRYTIILIYTEQGTSNTEQVPIIQTIAGQKDAISKNTVFQ